MRRTESNKQRDRETDTQTERQTKTDTRQAETDKETHGQREQKDRAEREVGESERAERESDIPDMQTKRRWMRSLLLWKRDRILVLAAILAACSASWIS